MTQKTIEKRISPQKLHKHLKPILFIDHQCQICVRLSEYIKRWDSSDNISVQSLQSIVEGHTQKHSHLKSLAQSKTTMIFAEPKMNKKGSIEFLYSQKGRAVLRLFKYMHKPVSFIAALERLPLVPQISDGFYTLFAKIRKYL